MASFRTLSALLLLGLMLANAAPVRLYPVDDASRDSSFRSYVKKLRSAVDKRNVPALRKLVDSDVYAGPEDKDKGWQKFSDRWRLEDGGDSPVWSALGDLLALGFVQEHPQLFLSPYVVWRFPRNLSASGHLVVIRDKVALRESPSSRASSVGTVSFEVVQQAGGTIDTDQVTQWIAVRTLDGQTGYVETKDVRSPLMPRAQFALQGGKWTMVALERNGP